MSVFPGLGWPGGAGGGWAAAGLTFDMPGQSAAFTSAPLAAPLQVTGAPTVRIRVSGAGQTLFAKVYDVDQAGNATLPFQLAAPLRVTAPVAGRPPSPSRCPPWTTGSPPGTGSGSCSPPPISPTRPRRPREYLVALAGSGLRAHRPALTVQTARCPGGSGPPRCGAGGGRFHPRRAPPGRGGSSPDLAAVPLEITGLTNRSRDGQLAVDDLSLRVERGQILGLLGPNGAGKTTTLRMLMGLIHPDAGTITIFGRQVLPAPALSRLGSFVEGPGFLPHLSGRANLDLYWRATGRPAAVPGGGARGRRPWRRHRPAGSRLLPRHAAAAGDRPGHARPARPPCARRADERPRPAADQGDARRPAALRGGGADRHPVQPPARRGRADLRPRGRDRRGPPDRRRPGGRTLSATETALLVGTTQADRAVSVLRDLARYRFKWTGTPTACRCSPTKSCPPGRGRRAGRSRITVDRVSARRRLEDTFLALIDGAPGYGAGPLFSRRRRRGTIK